MGPAQIAGGPASTPSKQLDLFSETAMELRTGQSYTLRNEATRETARFTLSELREYRGQYIAYGETSSHTIYLPASHGVVPIRARASCFPFFPSARAVDVVQFMNALNSLPLYLVLEGGLLLPVVNVHRAGGAKDGIIAQAAELVRAWGDWQRLGHRLPVWFRDILRTEQGH